MINIHILTYTRCIYCYYYTYIESILILHDLAILNIICHFAVRYPDQESEKLTIDLMATFVLSPI